MNKLHKKMVLEICEQFNCRYEDIFSKRRTKNIVFAKKIIYWILRKEGLSYNQIAQMLMKDHETVLVGIRTLPDELKNYALATARKYKKLYNTQEKQENQRILEEKVIKIVNLLNQGENEEGIAKRIGENIEDVIYKVSNYVEKKKIPNYSCGGHIERYFYKKNKKN